MSPVREPMSIIKFRKLIKLYLTRLQILKTEYFPVYMSCCVIVLCWCLYGYMQNAHYIIFAFGWVGGGMGGISPLSRLFHHFHVLFLSIFLY